jgi:hypothetical protein
MIMNWRWGVAAAVALIALCGTAEADILTAGPVYGGAGQINGKVVCWLFNTGTSTVTVSSRQIFSTDGGFTNLSVALTSDGCKNPLGAEKGCQFSAPTGGRRWPLLAEQSSAAPKKTSAARCRS